MPDAKANRPAGNGPVQEDQVGARSVSYAPTLDLSTLSARELELFLAGVMHGAMTAHDLEHERAERHAEALHRRAYEVVQSFAKIPPRDAEADAIAAERREQWWAERRSA